MAFELQEPAVAYSFPQTIEEFLSFVETKEDRFEFYKGELIMMAGSTKGHAIITFNFHTKLKEVSNPKGCMTFQESVYLRIQSKNTLFLPDIIITCDPLDFSLKSLFVEHPSIIVEILSDSTSSYDRGEKWEQYRKIPSLRYYILVSQQKPMVEVFFRTQSHSLFFFEAFEGLDSIVDLREMDIKIPMKDIYADIDFGTFAELP